MDFPKTDRNKVKRLPNRGHYDRETIYSVLDAGFLCHVGFVAGEQPFVIPTLSIWAGVVPIQQTYGSPEPDPVLTDAVTVPPSVRALPGHE